MKNLKASEKIENFRTDILNYIGAVNYPISTNEVYLMNYLNLLRLSDKIDNYYNLNLLSKSYNKTK